VVTEAISDLVDIQKVLFATNEVTPAPHEVTKVYLRMPCPAVSQRSGHNDRFTL